MGRIFTRKQFSNYLGENRAIDDIITDFTIEPTYWVVNVLDCDCNEQLSNQILKDNTGNVSGLSLNDSFSNEFNPNIIFYLISSNIETTPNYTINGGLFSSDPDCSLVTCFT